MKEIFPWILATALLLAGSAFLYAGVKLTSTAWTLKTSGEQTTATIERVEVREAHVRKDDAPAIVHYYTEVVSFTAWDGSKVEARLPEKNDDEARGRPSDPIEIRYRHDDPSVAAPVNGSPLGIQGPILIIAGLALLAFGAILFSSDAVRASGEAQAAQMVSLSPCACCWRRSWRPGCPSCGS